MIALVALAGGLHLPAIQVVAWAGMIAGDAGEYGLSGAVDRTFDGSHPCGLCDFVDAATEENGNEPIEIEKSENTSFKLIPLEVGTLAKSYSVDLPDYFLEACSSPVCRAEDPSVPPPRVA